jgi:hypothetical protein
MPPTDLTGEVHARVTAHRLESSKIREVANAGAGLSGVIPLWFGEPDIVTPEFVRAAALPRSGVDGSEGRHPIDFCFSRARARRSRGGRMSIVNSAVYGTRAFSRVPSTS